MCSGGIYHRALWYLLTTFPGAYFELFTKLTLIHLSRTPKRQCGKSRNRAFHGACKEICYLRRNSKIPPTHEFKNAFVSEQLNKVSLNLIKMIFNDQQVANENESSSMKIVPFVP